MCPVVCSYRPAKPEGSERSSKAVSGPNRTATTSNSKNRAIKMDLTGHGVSEDWPERRQVNGQFTTRNAPFENWRITLTSSQCDVASGISITLKWLFIWMAVSDTHSPNFI